MKKTHFAGMALSLIAALGWNTALMGQEGFQGVNSEAELAARVTQRVQEIIGSTEGRLAAQAPVVDTLPREEGQREGRILKLWMENEKAVKLTVSEPDGKGEMIRQSTFYFGGQDLFYVAQPFARFIFIEGRLEYWLDEEANVVPTTSELLDNREDLLYDEANRYLEWFFGRD